MVDNLDLMLPQDHKRPSRDPWLMTMAYLVALRSTCNRGQVGALLVKDFRVISMGYNGGAPGSPHCIDEGCWPGESGECLRTIHAEVNCILQAARLGIATQGCTLYSTHQPCHNCEAVILSSGITKVVYHNSYHHPGLRGGLELVRCEPLTPIDISTLVGALQAGWTAI